MNKYYNRTFRRFDLRNSQVALNIRRQIAEKEAVVSYKSSRNPKREKERRRIEWGILTASTCLFMCVYECDEGCIQRSVPSCIEQILILKVYLFARRALSTSRVFLLRLPPPNDFRLYFKSRRDVYPQSYMHNV